MQRPKAHFRIGPREQPSYTAATPVLVLAVAAWSRLGPLSTSTDRKRRPVRIGKEADGSHWLLQKGQDGPGSLWGERALCDQAARRRRSIEPVGVPSTVRAPWYRAAGDRKERGGSKPVTHTRQEAVWMARVWSKLLPPFLPKGHAYCLARRPLKARGLDLQRITNPSPGDARLSPRALPPSRGGCATDQGFGRSHAGLTGARRFRGMPSRPSAVSGSST